MTSFSLGARRADWFVVVVMPSQASSGCNGHSVVDVLQRRNECGVLVECNERQMSAELLVVTVISERMACQANGCGEELCSIASVGSSVPTANV
jgi:hypothetical protein